MNKNEVIEALSSMVGKSICLSVSNAGNLEKPQYNTNLIFIGININHEVVLTPATYADSGIPMINTNEYIKIKLDHIKNAKLSSK